MMSDLSFFEDGPRERDISIICEENKEKVVSEDLMEVFFNLFQKKKSPTIKLKKALQRKTLFD